jgi:PAS domain S-box-containing protein
MPSAQFFESILESLTAGVVTVDADGCITYVDETFCDAVDADSETLYGENLFDALVPGHSRADAREAFRERLEADASDPEDASADERPVVIGSDSAVETGRSRLLVWESTIRSADQRFVVGRLDGTTTETLRADAESDPFRAFVENAPVPILVSDETGYLRELNDEAERLTGRSRAELIGEKITTLHPADESDRYEELFETHVEMGGTRRYRPDGEQIHIVDGQGDTVPVEISVAAVEPADDAPTDEALIHGIFRDISDYVWYEQTLEELHENARDLVRAETDIEIAESIVETAVETINRDFVAAYLFDSDDERLHPIAHSDGVSEAFGDLPSLPLGESLVGKAYLTSESVRLADVRTEECVHDPDTPVRSVLVAPIDGFGAIVCGHTSVDEFEVTDQRLLELLARNAETVFARTEREQELRGQRRELEAQTEALQQIEQLNADIREIVRIAITADTRAELEQKACELFSTTDPFSFAWTGSLSPERDELLPQAWAGEDQGYLDTGAFTLDDTVEEPAVRTARTGEKTVVQNTATEVQHQPWRRDAVRRGFRSAVAIPIQYQGVLYGVFTVFASERDAVSDRTAAVLEECGELLGCMMSMMEWEDAVLSGQGTELDFEIRSQSCPLIRLALEQQCSVSFGGLHRKENGETTVFVRLLAGTAEQVVQTAVESTGIASIRQLGDTGDRVLFQVTFSEPFIATILAKHGIRLQQIVGEDETNARIRVTTPSTMPVHRAVDIVSATYPDAELLAVTEPEDPPVVSDHSSESALDGLTDRQRETIELAYYGGYFESPKGLSGTELAVKMDISSSSFHNRLRAAQRHLLSSLLDGGTADSGR